MRATLLLLCLLLAGEIQAQGKDHVRIGGTHVSLIPPPGFTAAASFSGLEHKATGASILVAELPTPVQQLTAGMSEAALAARGMRLLQMQAVSLHGTPATLLRVSQKAGGTAYQKQILLFGDATQTVLVTGTYPEATPAAAGPVQAALLSTFYAPQTRAEVPAAPFGLNVAGTRFRFAKNLAGSLLYTTDGRPAPQGPDQAAVIVGTSLGAVDVADADQEQYSLLHLRQTPNGQTLHVRSSYPITINRMRGYEVIADGQDAQGRPQLVYQVMLFADTDKYYLIVGITDNHFDEHLATFQALAQTFRRR
ncbi:hypothetical protein [Hymenobacter algoricola]|uniref:DUF1795 domain-containing protein n=1 Tax=Hymenobacter algoricola TaxID=486267 RepID=A0ABP7MPN1_9BACT